jgi:hypothetical protein
LGALVAATASAGLHAQGIYRWVGPHGTVHYSDVPPAGNRYHRVELAAPSGFGRSLTAKTHPPTPAGKKGKPAPKARKVPGLTPAQAQVFCRVARKRYHSLEPVRRLRLVQPNGKSQYLSGENLVQYKNNAKARMYLFCKKAGRAPG